MLRDHSNKWNQKHTTLIQASDGNHYVLAVNGLILLLYYSFFCEKELFQRGWGVFVILEEILEGLGGHRGQTSEHARELRGDRRLHRSIQKGCEDGCILL